MFGARAAALAAGKKRYVGLPCKRGHSGLRYTCSRNCVECISEDNNSRDEWKRILAGVYAEIEHANVEARAALEHAYRTGKIPSSRYKKRAAPR